MYSYEKEIKDALTRARSKNFWRVEVFDKLPSSNDHLKLLADKKSEGHIVVCATQTKGRGRQSRVFYSLDGGLYFSILLHPDIMKVTRITAMTAVAVRDAVESVFGVNPDIKWVNDIYLDKKKICGILAESSFLCESVKYVVLGVGVNVYEPKEGFPEEICDIAGSIEKERGNRRGKLLAEFLDNFYSYYVEEKDFVSSYRERSCLVGRSVVLDIKSERVEGVVTDIDDECRLVLNTLSGERRFSSGEVIKVRT